MHKPLTRVTPGRKAAQRRGRSPARGRLAEPSQAREGAARPQVQNAWERQQHGNDKAQLENQEAKSLAAQSRCRCRQWELGLPDFPTRMPLLTPERGSTWEPTGPHRPTRARAQGSSGGRRPHAPASRPVLEIPTQHCRHGGPAWPLPRRPWPP